MKRDSKKLAAYLVDCLNRGVTPVPPEEYSKFPGTFITHKKFVIHSTLNRTKSKVSRAKGRVKNASKVLTPEGRWERSFGSQPPANKVKANDYRWGTSEFRPLCLKGKKHSFKHLGESGNPYEGGDVISKCEKCGILKYHSEDGVTLYPPDHKPYFRTIQDDMRSAGITNVDSVPRQILFMEGYQGPEQIKELEKQFGPEDKW
jgi:hypothetical protein